MSSDFRDQPPQVPKLPGSPSAPPGWHIAFMGQPPPPDALGLHSWLPGPPAHVDAHAAAVPPLFRQQTSPDGQSEVEPHCKLTPLPPLHCPAVVHAKPKPAPPPDAVTQQTCDGTLHVAMPHASAVGTPESPPELPEPPLELPAVAASELPLPDPLTVPDELPDDPPEPAPVSVDASGDVTVLLVAPPQATAARTNGNQDQDDHLVMSNLPSVTPGACAGALAAGTVGERTARTIAAREHAAAGGTVHGARGSGGTRRIAVSARARDVARALAAVGETVPARAVERAVAGGGARELAVAGRAVGGARRRGAGALAVARGAGAGAARARCALSLRSGAGVRHGRAAVGRAARGTSGAGTRSPTRAQGEGRNRPKDRKKGD